MIIFICGRNWETWWKLRSSI